jgi:RimJ/RimL family protein N-acetyltransferase
MKDRGFTLRRAEEGDFDRWVALYEAVAAEGTWIGGEVPVDHDRLRQGFAERFVASESARIFLAEAGSELIGHLGIESHRGVADLGMMVAAGWRGRGVGTALLDAAIEWARESGDHKVVLQVWPHNTPAQALYRKSGFVEEGRLLRHYRRRNGELWDAIAMGLVLDRTSPGSSFDASENCP